VAGRPVVDLASLRDTVLSMSPSRAWEWVESAAVAAPGAPRRFLPGSSAVDRDAASYGRRLAAAAILIILTLAADGEPAAQILALSLPRVLLRRGTEIPGQIFALARDEPPMPSGLAGDCADPPPDPDPVRSWCVRLARAQEEGNVRRIFELALDGPETASLSLAEASPALDKLFPHKLAGEIPDGGEAAEWSSAAAAHIAAAPSPAVSARDVLVWARTHRLKAADAGGWCGQVLVDLHATEPTIVDALARFWSLPPDRIPDARARAFAFRHNNGTLLPRPGKDPRPISAPNVPRKVLSACDARRAREASGAYCEARGQVGLSHGGALLAYSIFPRLVVALGGTTCSADNSMSFQSFTRQGLLDGARAFLRSPEAALHSPESAAAFARLMDVCVFDSERLRLPRTSTSFARLHTSRTSHALAQGCSSSPTAEAVTLASAPPPQPFPLALRKAAHDDSQASGLPGCPLEAFAPPPSWGGAVYNTAKCVAVGSASAALVARGYASTAAPYSSVFGAPVGDADGWVCDVWAPKFRRVLSNLRTASAVDTEAAISAAHALRGPGGFAAHWLRTTPVPPGSAAEATLAAIDLEWVMLWLSFGTNGSAATTASLQADDVIACWDRVFGSGGACLGHASACWSSANCFAAGRRAAWPTISRWAVEMGADWRTFARSLGAPAEALGVSATTNSVGALFAAEAARTLDAYCAATRAAADRIHTRPASAVLGRGAQSSPQSRAARHPNLWIHALGGSLCPLVPSGGGFSPDGLRDRAGLAVAFIFGLPIWDALRTPRPTSCAHCLAPATADSPASSLPSVSLPAEPSPRALAPHGARSVLDNHGHHIAVCDRSGVLAGCKYRHDAIARDQAVVSNASGMGGQYHDGPIFRFGRKQRPADFLQKHPRYPRGEAVDITVGLAEVNCAAQREADKVKKFACQLSIHPELGFRPFGASTDGDIGPCANSLVVDWSRLLGRRRTDLRLPVASPHSVIVTAVARAFARAMIFQAVQWTLAPLLRGRP
jgi:hypothetical protein